MQITGLFQRYFSVTQSFPIDCEVFSAPQAAPGATMKRNLHEGVHQLKALLLFYSRTGTTRKIAGEILASLTCAYDQEELVDRKKRAGIVGWLKSGRDAQTGKLTQLEPLHHDPDSYDLVIVGTPVWAGKMAPAIRTFLLENRGKMKEVALFATHGSASSDTGYRALHEMEQLCGKKAVGTMQISSRDLRRGGHALKAQNFAVEVSIY
jgi:flavodoxin